MKLTELHEVISAYKGLTSEFFPGDLRSDQFCDLPIISLWGNMKMLPISHKPTKITQFFQDHSYLLALSMMMIWVQPMIRGHIEVI